MHIVKLGGSLYRAAELKSWLALLLEYSLQTPVVIVPGGGPFADMVRQAQTTHQFDDEHAHHMAILAMTQYGLLLHALLPTALTIKTPAEAPTSSQLAIWLPDDQLLQADELIQNWHTTSDSLALWFAQQHSQSKLSLIKHVAAETGEIKILSEEGIIDKSFHDLFRQQPINSHLIYYQCLNDFPDSGVALV